jgi:hypothetical protein
LYTNEKNAQWALRRCGALTEAREVLDAALQIL